MNRMKKRTMLHRIMSVLAALVLLGGIITVNAAEKEENSNTESEETTEYMGGGAAVTKQAQSGGYATKLYDATNGLPTSEANTIYATSDGFIWIGGYSGLVRYDGTSFQRQDSSGGITNANTLYEDSKGRLWIGTNDNGVVMVDKGESAHYGYSEGLLSSSVRTITEDSDGTILIGTTHGIAYIDEDMNLTNLNDPQIADAYILRMVTDDMGNVYGCTKSGATFSIFERRLTSYYNGSDLGIGDVTTIYPDPENEGYVYLGTDSDMICRGSFEQDLEDLEKISVSPASGINWITYASGRIWVISDSVVGYLDEDGAYIELQNLPMNSAIGSMIEDYEGNLWFSSSRQGIMKIVANRFTNISEQAALDTAVVNSTCLHDGMLYIGTDTGLQIIDEHNKIVENELTEYMETTRIRCIVEDKDGNIWISTYNNEKGLICYTPDQKIVSYTEEDGLLDNQTRCTSLASDGSILEGTNGGLTVLKDGKIVKNYGADSGISNTIILTVTEGDEGKYYLGTDGDGIYIIDGNKITRKSRDDGLTSEVILRIKKDEKRGVYWIITSNSIAYMRDEEITTVKEFPYSNNYDIYFDESDNAWILSSNGIYVVNAQDMIDNGTFDYLFYDSTSGLPSVATGNSFSALDEDGTLYIAGRSGVSSVNINGYFEQTHAIKLTVPYIEVDDERYYLDENNSVTIPSSTKVMTIYGYVLTYSMQNPKIQYSLEGFDTEVTLLTKQDMEPVRYTNLDGGRYLFHLSVVNTSTNEVQQTISIKIVKKMAFYERPWFWIVLVVVLVVLLTILVQRYIKNRTEALAREAEEKRVFVNEIIDAFANCVDSKDEYTNGHSRRVAKYTKMLAEKLGESEENIENYYNIALMHDIGKISIPDAILNKQSKLDDDEYVIMKSHAQRGYEILKDVKIQEDLAAGAYYHHERFDGKGYPQQLAGEEIPWVARIIAVADTFDAMYSTRPYRKKLPLDYVAGEIEKGAGTQLDPTVVEKFMELVREGAFDDE